MRYLDKINSSEDLKKLNKEQLVALCEEVREFLLKSVSQTGGHLASNLGVVELTVALHYCFDLPKDKIIWDVGHQSYTHKILTGRKDKFSSLRKKDGLSGFPKSEESEYDAFNTGHSSTSISAAIGLATARDLLGQNFEVVSVIGDGSMTGGLVYEALNNAGRNSTRLLIVLNDNQMSISKNVGAMSKYFSELRSAPKYIEVKKDVYDILNSFPIFGAKVSNVLEKTKDGIKYALIPSALFEKFGIKYIGPIDGHNINKLVGVLNKVKNIEQPVILHVLTKKGKGYKKAEQFPTKFHGIGSFDLHTGKTLSIKAKETYSEVFGKTLVRIAAKNKRIVAVTAAMPSGTGLEFFMKTYPKRIFDVGIAEEHAVTFAAGMSKGGFIPVFAVYSTFLQRSYDQILHDVCIQKLHVVFAVDRAGIVGEDGETHQGIYDLSYLSHIPNLTVIAPKNKNEFVSMLEFALSYNAPIAIRYPKGACSEILSEHNDPIVLSEPEIIFKGEKIVVISVGAMMDTCYGVYERLKQKGFNPSLINARFISPISKDFIYTLNKEYKFIFTVEDNIISGGFGAKLTQMIACKSSESALNKIIYNFAFPVDFIKQGSRKEIFSDFGLDEESIFNKIISLIDGVHNNN